MTRTSNKFVPPQAPRQHPAPAAPTAPPDGRGEPNDRVVVLPKMCASRKRRWLKAAARKREPLADWVVRVCDEAADGTVPGAEAFMRLHEEVAAQRSRVARLEADQADFVGEV